MSDAVPLHPRWEALLELSAAIAARDADALDRALAVATRDADPAGVEEAILQAHLFVGFPDALSALALWRERSGRPAPAPSEEGCAEWEERGAAVCALVYGTSYAKLRGNVRRIHPDLDRWMVDGGYGRVIGRGGLDLATRELCTVALLVVWDAPPQLHSHLRGALRVGAPPAEVERAVGIGCAYAAAAAAARAKRLWARVRARADTREPSRKGVRVS